MIATDAPARPAERYPAASSLLARLGESPRSRDALAIGLLLLLSLAAAIVWMPFSLYRLDNLTFYYPWYVDLGQSLRSLDIPGWLPTNLSGSPMAGDPQSGWGYLPAMAIMTAFPSLFGYKLFLIFHILFAAVSSYFYARNLGIGPLGAFTTGLFFTFGNFLERTSCCTIHMQVAIWIPAVFLCIDRSQLASTRNARIGWLLLGGVGVSQIVAGWVGQGAYYGGLAVAAYVIYRYLINPRIGLTLRQRLFWLASSGVVIGIITVSLSLTAIIPRLDVVSRSTLSNLYDDGAGAREQIGWSIAVLAERALGELVREGRWYLGSVGLALAVMAPILLTRRRDVVFFSVYSIVVLSLIVEGSPTILLFSLLPEFESLHSHSPDRIYIILLIGPAILAGFVVDALANSRLGPPNPWRIMATVQVPLILMVAALILVQAREREWLPTSNVLLVIVACVSAGVALLRFSSALSRIAVIIVVAALLTDTPGQPAWKRLSHSSSRDSASHVVDSYVEPTGAARWLQDRRDDGEIFRFFGYDLAALTIPNERATYAVGHYRPGTASILINNRGIRLDLDDIQGYNPVQIRRYVTYFRHLNNQSQSYHTSNVLENGLDSPLLHQLNVRYIVLPAEIPANRPDLFHATQQYPTVYRDETNRILENPDALPRAWIVHEAVRTKTGQILPQYVEGLVDPATTALMDSVPPDLEPAPESAADSVEIVHRDNDEIRIRVDAASRGMVVLSEVWDPGWTATVDGENARIYRTHYLFRGVVVDAGEHEIVLRFPANDVKWTLLFYLIPVAAFGALGLAWLWARRRPTPDPISSWPTRPGASESGNRRQSDELSEVSSWSDDDQQALDEPG